MDQTSDSFANSVDTAATTLSNAFNTKADDIVTSLNVIASNINRNISESQEASYGSSNDLATYITGSIGSLENTFANRMTSIEASLTSKLSDENAALSYLDKDYHTYWMKVTYTPNGVVANAVRQDEPVRKLSIVESLKEAFTMNDKTETITYNSDGTYDKTVESQILSIAYILKNLTVVNRVPSYEEFMADLVPKLYVECDFEKEIVDTETKDENGNILSKAKHKPNPIDMARKSIYRADILWNEMKKKGIVDK